MQKKSIDIRQRMEKHWVLLLAALMAVFACYHPITVKADGDWGEAAYQYMDYLSRNFEERIATNDVNKAAREWLLSEITALGYEYTLEEFSGASNWGGDTFGQNIIFSRAGQSSREIIVCAHYDSAWAAGADDNASGVGVLLEVAQRVQSLTLPYTVRFILFDAEEPGCVGSTWHVAHASAEYLNNILYVINIDTVAAGDYMMAYGGDYHVENNEFTNLWTYHAITGLAERLGIDLRTHPEVNSTYPAPTKATGSDNGPFNAAGIPYIYFEASNWMGGDYTNFYQTSSELVEDGKIMHVSEYDNMDFLMGHFGDRVRQHLHDYVRLTIEALLRLEIPEDVLSSVKDPDPTEAETVPEETEGETVPGETGEETDPEETGEVSESSEDETSPEATETEGTQEELEETDSSENMSDATLDETGEGNTEAPSSKETTAGRKDSKGISAGLVIAILIIGVVVIFIIIFGLSVMNERRAQERRRRNRNGGKERK